MATATKNQPGNQTPNTPDINESEIARLKVDELRDRLRRRGITGTSEMHKEELVKTLINALREDPSSGGGSARRDGKNPPGNQTPNTPDINESEIVRLKVDELRDRLRQRGITGTSEMHKDELVKTLIKALREDHRETSAPEQRDGNRADGGGGIRTGPQTSRSIKYAQEVTSADDEPERDGRSLVTTSHDVIRRWAQERNGVPATVDGTEHDGRAGVLRIDFPAGASDRLRQIDWDEWFAVFDKRRLNFIYQETRSDGRQSNFFRLENPDREDG